MLLLENGNDMKIWRKKNHLTQQQLADSVDYSIGRISHIESQNEILTPKLKAKILELDSQINPSFPGEKILNKWKELDKYRNVLESDLDEIESLIIDLMTPSKKDIRYLLDNIDYVKNSLKALIEMRKMPFTDKQDYKDKANHLLNEIYQASKKLV